jgi:hypothetical protein
MAYQLPRIISVNNRVIKVAHLDLSSQPLTYLLSDLAAGGTALTVIDNVGFADTNLILLGELGAKGTEIKKVNAAVTAGTSLTSTTVTFAHPAGTPIRKILFNQFKIYGTTTSTFATTNLISGSAINIAVDEPYTTYVNTGTEYAYYWVVPYDSLSGGAVTGDNSDSILASTGNPVNSVGYLINSALEDTKKNKGGTITDEWLMRQINEGLEFVAGKLKHWSFLQNFDYSLGSVLQGTYSFTMPTDIADKNTIKSILGVRIGTDENLTFLDKREWEEELEGVTRTQVRTQGEIGDITLAIDNSYDFEDAGSVDVYVSGVKYTLTYTGVTRSTTAGVLTGIPASGTGSITVTLPVDSYVWQNQQEGQPTYFTVYDGNLYVWPLANSSNDYKNASLDYYTTRTLVDSSSDTIEPPRYDAIKEWLNWKLRGLDNASGKLDFNDSGFVMFDLIVKDMIKKEISGQKWNMKRQINQITY